jgi:predicted RNA-binding protein with PIN domain
MRYAKSPERILKTHVLHKVQTLYTAETADTVVEHLIYHFPAHSVARDARVLAQSLITGSDSGYGTAAHWKNRAALVHKQFRREEARCDSQEVPNTPKQSTSVKSGNCVLENVAQIGDV